MTTKFTPRLGGYIKDPHNPKDFLFDSLKPKLLGKQQVLGESVDTDVVDLRKWCSLVEHQSDISSCVGNAVVGALEFLYIKKGLPLEDLSRMFVYYNARLMHKAQDEDKGTHIVLAMGTLSVLGTCSEKIWPYNPKKVFIRPDWKAYRAAFAHKISSYYRISSTGKDRIEDIKSALDSGFCIVFGMIVDQDYVDTSSSGMVAMPQKTRVNVGGHAQVIVGYNDTTKRFIVRNSWGTNWADKGYAYVPYDYLDASDASDFWVPTDLI